ncbi:nucleotide-diphospho-sugar transferase [Blastocladiella britannica]|nr:nucleotide-diphospho-sugar transferase [Blastocladiella britannica]
MAAKSRLPKFARKLRRQYFRREFHPLADAEQGGIDLGEDLPSSSKSFRFGPKWIFAALLFIGALTLWHTSGQSDNKVQPSAALSHGELDNAIRGVQINDLDGNAAAAPPVVTIPEVDPSSSGKGSTAPAETAPAGTLPETYRRALEVRDAHLAKWATNDSKWTVPIPPMVHSVWVGPLSRMASNNCRGQWASMNPDHDVLLWDESSLDVLVDRHFAHLSSLYRSLPKIVMRADWARLMILSVFGGVYADLDACPLRPLSEWTGVDRALVGRSTPVPSTPTIHDIGVAAGCEMDTLNPSYRNWANRPFQLTSWTLLSVPGHPVWSDALLDSAGRVRQLFHESAEQSSYGVGWQKNAVDEVCDRTGPGLVTDAILGYAGHFGDTSLNAMHGLSQPRQFGDAVILPITAFSPGNTGQGAKGTGDRGAFVNHLFFGAWKGHDEKV